MGQETRNTTRHETLIAIGRLIKPHGIQGEIVLLPYVYDLTLLPDLLQRPVMLQKERGPLWEGTLVSWRVAHKKVLVRLLGCNTPPETEALRGCEVLIPRRWFSPLPPEEYYWFEVEGLTVYAHDGRFLGTLTEIIYTGSNDVYVVQDGTHEILVPALKDVVRTIDLDRGELHLRTAEGLFE